MRKFDINPSAYLDYNNPRALVFGAVVLWAFAGTLLGLMAESKIFSILAVAFFASTVFNFLLVKSNKNYGRPRLISDFKWIIFGLVGYFFYNLFFGLSILNYQNASEATVLNYTWPFFTALFTILIYKRQQLDGVFAISTILGLSGILLLASRGNLFALNFGDSIFGLVFGLLTGMSYGLFSAYSSEKDLNELPNFLFNATFYSFILMVPFAFWYYGPTAFELGQQDIFLALISGLLLDSMGHVLWTRVQSLTAERGEDIKQVVAVVYYLPIVSLLLISWVLGEQHLFKSYFAIAVILVTASALFPTYYERYKKAPKKKRSIS